MLHVSTIKPDTLELLRRLQSLPCSQHTRLVGGTALALQLGHRKSDDLKLFGQVTADLETLEHELSSLGQLTPIYHSKNINRYILNEVPIEITNHSHPWLKEVIVDEGIRMASLEDICAMTFYNITGEGEKKDFVDVFFLLKHFTFEQMMGFYLQKYPRGDEFVMLKSVVFYDEAEETPMPEMLEDVSWEMVKERIDMVLE